jgi:hypothetical protein
MLTESELWMSFKRTMGADALSTYKSEWAWRCRDNLLQLLADLMSDRNYPASAYLARPSLILFLKGSLVHDSFSQRDALLWTCMAIRSWSVSACEWLLLDHADWMDGVCGIWGKRESTEKVEIKQGTGGGMGREIVRTLARRSTLSRKFVCASVYVLISLYEKVLTAPEDEWERWKDLQLCVREGCGEEEGVEDSLDALRRHQSHNVRCYVSDVLRVVMPQQCQFVDF